MKILNYLIVFFLAQSSIVGFAQSDSIIINRVSDEYIEIKSLRHLLDSSNSCGSGCWEKIDLRPKPPKIENSVVFVKDRLNRPMALYIFKEFQPIHEDHYENGQLSWQLSNNPIDSSGIEKYFWENGNLKNLIMWKNGEKIIFDYSNNGELIKN